MCGVFGFVAKNDHRMSLADLKRVAAQTMTRGPHAWGLAWIDSQDRLKMFKQTGRIVDALGLLAMARDAKALIGHCRWATQGDPQNNLNNHPHPADGGWIVHNGIIRHYDELIDEFDLHPVSDCDSELLGQLIERLDGDLVDRCERATLYAADSPLTMLGLWKSRLVAVRRGNPLHTGQTRSGIYLASLPDALPGRVSAVTNNTLLTYSV